MEKITELMEKYPTELYDMVDKLYNEKFPKKKNPKLVFKFRALGKNYDEDVVSNNYKSFLSDISKIHSPELFGTCISNGYIYKGDKEIGDKQMKQMYKIYDNFYVSCYSSTEVKIRHIMSIADLIGIDVKIL
jgi:hypothetical protein